LAQVRRKEKDYSDDFPTNSLLLLCLSLQEYLTAMVATEHNAISRWL